MTEIFNDFYSSDISCRISGIDVLNRAKSILDNPLPDSHSEHGPYCQYCAIALAKDRLDDEHGGTPVPLEDCIMDFIKKELRVYPEDAPLIDAKKSMDAITTDIAQSKSEALSIIDNAINAIIN